MTGKARDRISRDLVDALYFAPALDDARKLIAAGYAELRKLISFDAGAYLTMDPANWSLGLGHRGYLRASCAGSEPSSSESP